MTDLSCSASTTPPTRNQVDTARSRAPGKQKLAFIINHVVCINKTAWPMFSGRQRHSYQRGDPKTQRLSPRNQSKASPEDLWKVQGLGQHKHGDRQAGRARITINNEHIGRQIEICTLSQGKTIAEMRQEVGFPTARSILLHARGVQFKTEKVCEEGIE